MDSYFADWLRALRSPAPGHSGFVLLQEAHPLHPGVKKEIPSGEFIMLIQSAVAQVLAAKDLEKATAVAAAKAEGRLLGYARVMADHYADREVRHAMHPSHFRHAPSPPSVQPPPRSLSFSTKLRMRQHSSRYAQSSADTSSRVGEVCTQPSARGRSFTFGQYCLVCP
jgi:hypothetical protein